MAQPIPADPTYLFCPPGAVPDWIRDEITGEITYFCTYEGVHPETDPETLPLPAPPGWTNVNNGPRGPAIYIPPPNRPSTPPGAVQPPRPFPNTGPIQLFGGPLFNPQPPVSSVTSTSTNTGITGDIGAEGPIFVNVDNAVNVADSSAANAVQSVANAIQQGLSTASSASTDAINASSQAVADAINNQSQVLDQGVNQAFTGIQNSVNGIVGSIGSTLGGIGQVIGNDIFNSINPVSTALSQIVTIISQQIGGLAGAIGTAVGQVIPLIVAAVTGAISPSSVAIAAISTAIRDSTGALIQLGSDITGGFGSLDSTLGRILTDYEQYNTPFVESQTGWGGGESAHKDLKNLWESLAGLISVVQAPNGVKLSDYLEQLCSSTRYVRDLNDVYSAGESPFDWIKHLLAGVAKLVNFLAKARPSINKYFDLAGKEIDAQCPSDLLPAAVLVDAVRRGFVTYDNANAEAAQGNLSDSRFKTLFDLSQHQMTPAELVEALYRGYIDQTGYTSALSALGWTSSQQELLRGLAVRQLPVGAFTALHEALRRGLISGSDFQQLLKSQAYDDAQAKLLQTLAFRPSTLTEATDGAASFDALTQLGAQGSIPVPEYASAAAAAEGLDESATKDRWYSHWQFGSLSVWIDLYFRGQIPIQALQAVMSASFIPTSLQTTLVEGSRPLIQYRTISTMLHLGIITVQQAGEQLLKHGYTPQDTQLLIDYAQRSGTPAKTAKAAVQHAASLAIAKEEYIDGSISENDYYQILLAHGFTIEGANAEIALENTKQAMLNRKQNAQLVVDEYGAGLINEQQALAQLASQGLTVYELAKYAHKIRAFKARSAKQPSEADLNHFLQLSIISADDYVAALVSQGYSQKWAQDFLAWRIHPTAPAGSAPAPSPAVP